MKQFLLFSALLFLTLLPLTAEPEVPANAWEQHSNRIALAVILNNRAEDQRPVNSIQVSVKNIGKENIFSVMGPIPFQIFYLNDRKELTPLRDYILKSGSVPTVVEQSFMPCEIKPGESVRSSSVIAPDELQLIKGHPVICKVFISDHEVGNYKTIESSPRTLVPDL